MCRILTLTFVLIASALCAEVEIVLPDAPRPWEQTAADELRHYLSARLGSQAFRVAGTEKVLFHVGDTPLAAEKGLTSGCLADEAWVVRSFNGNVVVNGGGTRGCLYAAYHFIEDKLGVRWWSETEEDVPAPSSLTLLALDMSGKPHFLYRDIYRTRDPARSQSRFAIRRRLNRNGDVPVPAALGGAFDYGPPYHSHTFDRYIPWKEFGATHPEWFSLRGGKRTGGQEAGTLCLANAEMRRVFKERLLASIAQGKAQARKDGVPAPRLYSVEMNDNPNACECATCVAASERWNASGYYLRFVNELASAVAEKHPDVLLVTSAYFYTSEPPKGVAAADNVLLKMANWQANLAASIKDASNVTPAAQYRKWSEHARLLFHDYAITFNKQTIGFPFPSEFTFGDHYRFWSDCRVTGALWEQERPDCADLYDLKFWLLTKLFEDPTLDASALIDQFMREYFGPAGADVLAAREILRGCRERNAGRVGWFAPLSDFAFIGAEDAAAQTVAFDRAEKAVAGDKKHLRRVKKARASIDRLVAFRASRVRREGDKLIVGPKQLTNKDKIGLAVKVVPDAAAPDGETVLLNPDASTKPELYRPPLKVGVWDAHEKKELAAKSLPLEDGAAYAWHDLFTCGFPSGSFVYFSRAWTLQAETGLPEIANGQVWRMRVLARAEKNKVYVAQVEFLPVQDNENDTMCLPGGGE